MQSLKTVTVGIRDLNNVHEITDLLAPNDPGQLYSAIERKAASWADKGAYSATTHKGSDAKSSSEGGKGKKANNERDRCKKCGKITNPPHWAKSCQVAVSTQVVLKSPPPSSASETAPPGLPVSVNSENVSALAAIVTEVLSPVGSSDSGRTARLTTVARSARYVVRQKFPVFAARDQTKHLSMVVDSSAEMRVVCPAHKHFMKKRDEIACSVATEDRWRKFDPRHDRGPALRRRQSLQRCQRWKRLIFL